LYPHGSEPKMGMSMEAGMKAFALKWPGKAASKPSK